jgi:hypothetical protein
MPSFSRLSTKSLKILLEDLAPKSHHTRVLEYTITKNYIVRIQVYYKILDEIDCFVRRFIKTKK